MKEWVDISTVVVSGVGSAALVAALLYSVQQVKTLRAQLTLESDQAERALVAQRASNDLKLMEHAMAVDRLFIDIPELRPYIYDGQDLPDEEPLRAQILATAELIVDLTDSVANMIRFGQLDPKDQEAWAIALGFYGRSPIVRLVAEQGQGAWRESTIALLMRDSEYTCHPVRGIRSNLELSDSDLSPLGVS
jgi:hypothetical protein